MTRHIRTLLQANILGDEFLTCLKIIEKFSIHHYNVQALSKFVATQHKVLESEIEHIYILEYGKSINNSLASVCVKNKINVHIFINTLKTLFINDFIPFNLYRLFCWNSTQFKLFKRLNPALKSSVFNNFGSPFHVFLRNIAQLGRTHFTHFWFNCKLLCFCFGFSS